MVAEEWERCSWTKNKVTEICIDRDAYSYPRALDDRHRLIMVARELSSVDSTDEYYI